jgi:uncharacterized membrane protein
MMIYKINIAVFIIVILICTQTASGAVIHGTIYSWETLEPLPKTVIVVNTTPEQQIVSNDGTYQINLSEGSYVLKALYYRDGKLELYTEENITVEKEGEYVFDLILFPLITDISLEEPEDIVFSIEDDSSNYGYAYLVVIPILVLIYFVVKKKRSEAKHDVSEFSKLPEDLDTVLSIIKREGGRITQKELRKKLGCSEAKMSLIIADLERRDMVEKVKKGRGNIIFLKDNLKDK